MRLLVVILCFSGICDGFSAVSTRSEPAGAILSGSMEADTGGIRSNHPVRRWLPLVAKHFEPEDVDTAMCVIRYESGGDPNAKNPRSSARGLFQILGRLWAPFFGIERDDLYDSELNVRLARRILDRSSWNAWSVYKNGPCHHH